MGHGSHKSPHRSVRAHEEHHHRPGHANPVLQGLDVGAEKVIHEVKKEFHQLKPRIDVTGALMLAGARGAITGKRTSLWGFGKDVLSTSVADMAEQLIDNELKARAASVGINNAELRSLTTFVVTLAVQAGFDMRLPGVQDVAIALVPAVAREMAYDHRIARLLDDVYMR